VPLRQCTTASTTTDAREKALTRTLTGTLVFLGTSTLALDAESSASDGRKARGPANAGEESGDGAATAGAAAVAADASSKEDGEAIAVLKRAHELLKAETAAIAATPSGRPDGPVVLNVVGGEGRGVEEVRRQTARVLDTLSEAYAGNRRWEQARWASQIASAD